MAITQKILAWRLFRRDSRLTGIWDVILWWEGRRLWYNIIVGCMGLGTCLFAVLTAIITPNLFDGGGGSPILIPFTIFGGIFLYSVGANVCFTGGWIGELLAKFLWKERATNVGEIFFGLGLMFSILLTLSPTVVLLLISIYKHLVPAQ